jgi:TolA-binding protein
LAKGAIASAERDVAAALASQPTRSQAAEAWTLRAECALVSGDPEGAAKLYRDVSGRYADLPAGETALFAAARIQANAGRPATAEALLRSYLARYPRGRFQSEATARLRALHEE